MYQPNWQIKVKYITKMEWYSTRMLDDLENDYKSVVKV